MKFITGDDTGILKLVRVEAQKVERLGPKRQGDAVERLCWAGPDDDKESQFAVGHASGVLELRNTANGQVISSATVAPEIRCLHSLAGGLLSVSSSGSSGIITEWPSDDADSNAVVKEFTLPGPVASARIDLCNADRLAFGGGENDVKIYDLARGDITWRAKNVREDSLCLRVPVKVSSLQWASQLASSRSLLLCGTVDGKIRLYDTSAQRRPLFEFLIGYTTGQASGGYTGAGDDQARPVNCSAVACRGDSWSLFVGNTTGVLREFDLRNLPTCKPAPVPPGRKSHLKWAATQLPFKRGYKGCMGSLRAVEVHQSGEALVAGGLGRFAYVFETRKRKMISKVFMKQMITAVLVSGEERKGAAESDDDASEDEPKDVASAEKNDEEGDEDAVQEGFSSDEANGEDEDAAQADTGPKKAMKRKRRPKSKGKARAKAKGGKVSADS